MGLLLVWAEKKEVFGSYSTFYTHQSFLLQEVIRRSKNLVYMVIVPVSFLVLARSGSFKSAGAGDALSP